MIAWATAFSKSRCSDGARLHHDDLHLCSAGSM
jgi:hypothetical protein